MTNKLDLSELHKFVFNAAAGPATVRGQVVRLTDAWQAILARRAQASAYPLPVQQLLGQMTAAAVLLAGNIKFNGALILQMMGDGPVKLAIVEVQPDFRVRATAKVVGEVAEGDGLPELFSLYAGARCAITLDPKDRLPGQQPYQGIVPLRTADDLPVPDVAQALNLYMRQSEQLDTRLVLAADGKLAAGLLIQRMPAAGGKSSGAVDEQAAEEDFTRLAHLTATLGRDELLGQDVPTILRRLFWDESLRLLEQHRPAFSCTCSRQRVERMLLGLGRQEADSILEEQGSITVDCDFCGARYRFDAVDVGGLFTPEPDQPPGSTRIQ